MRLPALPRVRRLLQLYPSKGQEPGPNAPESRFTLEKVYRSCRKIRRAAAAVEFAVVAPLFFLLVFGMIEFGRMVMVQQIITNGAREGARRAVLDGATTAQVVSVVDTYLAGASVAGASVEILDTNDYPINPGDAGYGEPVTVKVSIPFNQVSWLPSPMFLGGNTMTATTVMRRETIQ